VLARRGYVGNLPLQEPRWRRRPHALRPSARRSRRTVSANRQVLAGLALGFNLSRALARTGTEISIGFKASYLRADGGDRCCSNHELAGGHWWHAQLGLPLHLAPRRCLYRLWFSADWIPGGSGRLHQLA